MLGVSIATVPSRGACGQSLLLAFSAAVAIAAKKANIFWLILYLCNIIDHIVYVQNAPQNIIAKKRIFSSRYGIWFNLHGNITSATILKMPSAIHTLNNPIAARFPWWNHQMQTFSVLLTICAGNSPVNGEFHAQRPLTRSFGVFFNLRLNKRLSKQWWVWFYETPSRPLRRHCNTKVIHGHFEWRHRVTNI